MYNSIKRWKNFQGKQKKKQLKHKALAVSEKFINKTLTLRGFAHQNIVIEWKVKTEQKKIVTNIYLTKMFFQEYVCVKSKN